MKKSLLATALTVACGVAAAQGYAGALIGLAKVRADCTGTTSCDTSDTAYKLYGGYEVARQLSVEVGYTNFGKAQFTGGAFNTVKASAISVVGAFRAELGSDLTGVARLGLASVNTKWDKTNAGSASKMSLYAGLGLDYEVTPDFKLTGNLDLTSVEANGDTGGVFLFGIGAQMAY